MAPLCGFYDLFYGSLIMPQIERAIEDISTTNNRPVIHAVVRQVCEHIGIDPKIKIYFPDAKGIVAQLGSTITDVDNTAEFVTKTRLQIEVKEGPGFDGLYYDQRHKSNTKPIFKDQCIGLYVAPIITTRQFTVTFKYVSPDRIGADAWLEYFRSRILNNRLQLLHRAEGSFIVPEDIITIIEHCYALRENNAGYNEDIGTYFKNHSDNRFTVFTDQSGKNTALGFIIPYAEFLGFFDVDGEPEPANRDEKNETNIAEFTYKFQIDVPTSLLIRYPIIVHNQYINPDYLFEIKPTPYDDLFKSGIQDTVIGNYFARKRPALDPALSYGIRIPKHDDWLLPELSFPIHTLSLFTVLLTIDSIKPKDLFALKEIDGLDLPDFVWEYIISESRWILKETESLFQLTMYHQDEVIPPKNIVLGNNTEVSFDYVPNQRFQYHARLGIYLDLKYLSEEARKRLQEHGRVLDWWIKLYHPELLIKRDPYQNENYGKDWYWDLDTIGKMENKDYIPDYDFNQVIGIRGRGFDTVQTLELISTRPWRT